MSDKDIEFGFLTLAIKSDYHKAIGLALSLRVSNPGIPVAIACPESIRHLVEPYFDYVINQDPNFKGFAQKVNLDRYTPFNKTLFLDSDILVFKDLKPHLETWVGAPYLACGDYVTEGSSCFDLNISNTLQILNKKRFVKIEGVGHGLFQKPDCTRFFERAREVTDNYTKYAGNAKYADEDAVSIVMTEFDYPPAPWGIFCSRYMGAKYGTMKMNAVKGECSYIRVDTGEPISPCTMHFARDEAPFAYTWQLYKLYKHFNVPTKGLLSHAFVGFYKLEIKLRLHLYKKQLKRKLGIK